MNSSALSRLSSRLFRSLRFPVADRRAPEDDVWKVIASGVDSADAEVLPLSVRGLPGIAAGHRAAASLVAGHFLLQRLQERNERYIDEALSRRDRGRRRREVGDLKPYFEAFQEAIKYARTIADGDPASAKLPPLFQLDATLPLLQRFRRDRQFYRTAA
ncbi:hypothetical protein [Streptomyces sp. NPDC055912]|uniref:hypothetical protein n=1 Tax=Streptomyces sp. NPDC055912 TaxID=3345660 RepID=UPI0035D6338C